MSTWPVGTVAQVSIGDRVYERCLWDSYNQQWVDSREGRLSAQGMRKITGVRPLVVLDLSDQPVEGDATGRNEPTLLVSMLRETSENFFTPDAAALARKVADQIEAQTRPSKPAEPTGLGSVVQDREKRLWVRLATNPPWFHPEVFDKTWDQLDVVKVLSEGLTS